jgi:hypothetical protein
MERRGVNFLSKAGIAPPKGPPLTLACSRDVGGRRTGEENHIPSSDFESVSEK